MVPSRWPSSVRRPRRTDGAAKVGRSSGTGGNPPGLGSVGSGRRRTARDVRDPAVTRVQAPEGRDAMTRPLGPTKRSSRWHRRHGPAVAVHHAVVVSCKEDELGRSVPPPALPSHDVVHIGEGHVGTAGVPAVPVPACHLPALRVGREPLALPSYMVCPTSSSTATAMVASQAMRCTVSQSIRPSRSRSPASSVVLTGFGDQGLHRGVDHHEVGAGRGGRGGRARSHRREPVAATLVQGCVRVGRHHGGQASIQARVAA